MKRYNQNNVGNLAKDLKKDVVLSKRDIQHLADYSFKVNQDMVPVLTGKLKSSGNYSVKSNGFIIKWDVDYAIFPWRHNVSGVVKWTDVFYKTKKLVLEKMIVDIIKKK